MTAGKLNWNTIKNFQGKAAWNLVIQQKTQLHLVTNCTVGLLNNKPTFWITLENSQISPGKILSNYQDAIGYFQDLVEVELHFNGDPRMKLLTDSPQTVIGSNSTSSSISMSHSDSTSLNVGFFGSDLTGGVSFTKSDGSGVSKSFGANLSDLTVSNTSDYIAGHAKHGYKMTASASDPYKEATDLLINQRPIKVGPFGAGTDYDLAQPAPIAMDNMPLLSQAVWQCDDEKAVTANCSFQVIVKQHLAMVSKKGQQVSRTLNTYTYSESVDFSAVEVARQAALDKSEHVGTAL